MPLQSCKSKRCVRTDTPGLFVSGSFRLVLLAFCVCVCVRFHCEHFRLAIIDFFLRIRHVHTPHAQADVLLTKFVKYLEANQARQSKADGQAKQDQQEQQQQEHQLGQHQEAAAGAVAGVVDAGAPGATAGAGAAAGTGAGASSSSEPDSKETKKDDEAGGRDKDTRVAGVTVAASEADDGSCSPSTSSSSNADNALKLPPLQT